MSTMNRMYLHCNVATIPSLPLSNVYMSIVYSQEEELI
jgi:hypothetical protein